MIGVIRLWEWKQLQVLGLHLQQLCRSDTQGFAEIDGCCSTSKSLEEDPVHTSIGGNRQCLWLFTASFLVNLFEMGQFTVRGVWRANRTADSTDGIAEITSFDPVSRADIHETNMLAKAVLHFFARNSVHLATTMVTFEIAQYCHRHLEAVLFLVTNARDIRDGQP